MDENIASSLKKSWLDLGLTGVAVAAEVGAMSRIISLLQASADSFFSLDRELRFTYVCPSGERHLEKSGTELIGKEIWEVFPSERGHGSTMSARPL